MENIYVPGVRITVREEDFIINRALLHELIPDNQSIKKNTN